VYDTAKSLPDPATVETFDPLDDFTIVPYDKQELLPEPDQTVDLTVKMANLGDGAN
jgi:iron transport multicopper oxidase